MTVLCIVTLIKVQGQQRTHFFYPNLSRGSHLTVEPEKREVVLVGYKLCNWNQAVKNDN